MITMIITMMVSLPSLGSENLIELVNALTTRQHSKILCPCTILKHCCFCLKGHAGLPGIDGTPGVKGDEVK